MPSSPQLSLMTKILNLNGVYALNYSITDNVGIFISVEEAKGASHLGIVL